MDYQGGSVHTEPRLFSVNQPDVCAQSESRGSGASGELDIMCLQGKVGLKHSITYEMRTHWLFTCLESREDVFFFTSKVLAGVHQRKKQAWPLMCRCGCSKLIPFIKNLCGGISEGWHVRGSVFYGESDSKTLSKLQWMNLHPCTYSSTKWTQQT